VGTVSRQVAPKAKSGDAVREQWQSHIDEMLQQYRQMRDRLGELQREVGTLTATARSPDGLVTATVGGQGQLVGLRLDPEALRRLDETSLAAQIVTTAGVAAGAVRERASRTLKEFVPPRFKGAVGHDGNVDVLRLISTDPAELGETS
jgi:DNA-binding protein YbaB